MPSATQAYPNRFSALHLISMLSRVLSRAIIVLFQLSGSLPILRSPHGFCLARLPLISILPAFAFVRAPTGYFLADSPLAG